MPALLTPPTVTVTWTVPCPGGAITQIAVENANSTNAR